MALTKTSKKSAIRKAWVAALRSGKYTQGFLQLKSGKGSQAQYCCLGVLCDLAVKAGVITRFNGQCGVPRPKVVKWVGLRKAKGSYKGNDLVTRNDNGASFKAIAKIIEKQPKGLFTE